MLTLHPQILERDGRKEFAVLPYEEFIQLAQAVEDLEDLRLLRAAKLEDPAPGHSLDTVRKILSAKKK